MAEGTVDVTAWRPPIPGIREVLHASLAHPYPPHTHDTWTLFIVDDGAIRYDLDRRSGGEGQTMVSILPPHVVHDGRPANSDGYRKRVVYLEADVVGEHLIGAAVDRPQFPDPRMRDDVARLHDALACIDDILDAETQLHFLVERMRVSFGDIAPVEEPVPDGAEALRAYLDAHLFESVTLTAAADALEASPTQVARAFADAFGITPHAYVVGRRLDAARARILDGQPLADVATEVGFYDQAHLTRRFKRFLSVTPGRFASGKAKGT
ncbi:MAG TPA: AraC family transcriptional regulator [Candidatus Limnocylindrales bacterium]|nr:AraC family transcriptional regulator [Candidatus Limnocylindrales bacterium]